MESWADCSSVILFINEMKEAFEFHGCAFSRNTTMLCGGSV
jgi:hypothetical protein